MSVLLVRAVTAAVIGAMAGWLGLMGAFRLHPDLIFEMDRDLPGRTTSGVYPVEVSTTESFAWTAGRAQLTIQGVDRRVEWSCTVRARAGRAPGQPQPTLTLWADTPDGIVAPPAVHKVPGEYTDIVVTAARKEARGLRLYLEIEPTFRPAADPRPLGIQLDRIACAPAAAVAPPRDAVLTAAVAPALIGAAFALVGLSPWVSMSGAAAIALILAFPLSSGLGPYTVYVDRVWWSAVWISGVTVALSALIRTIQRRPAPEATRFAVAFSGAVLLVKLIAVLHPAKAVIDALFHTHRFDDVLAGKYFFTQQMPGGVQFPYAIALYVVTSPWASLTRDHMVLLRIVVSTAEAAAGLLLCWAAARVWRDAASAAAVLVLYHLVPVSFWVIGNANMTNAFGQSAAVATMALTVGSLGAVEQWRRGATSRRPGKATALLLVGVALMAATAFLSHVSTFMNLSAAMFFVVAIVAWKGGRDGRLSALMIAAAVAMAVAGSVALYYGRPAFFDAYKSIRSTQAEQAAPAPGNAAPSSAPNSEGGRLAEGALPTMTLPARVLNAVELVGDAIGWAILALAVIGGWRLANVRERNPIVWVAIAWALAGALFVAAGIILPGGVGHQRQAMEFIARAAYAASPSALVLAGYGIVWAWRRGAPLRAAAVALAVLVVLPAARIWISWLR